MSLPKKQYIRRQELIDWLNGLGFAVGDIRKWIASDVIPRRTFATAQQKARKGTQRAYYEVAAVADALQIANPLSK